MTRQRATRDSWKTQAMPALKAGLPVDRTFSPEEFERIRLGLVPKQMEDKWFIYLEDDWLFFHRSWTGHCIYQIRLEPVSDGYRVCEAWVNRDSQQYKNTDDAEDVALVTYLINRLLLGRDVPFPPPGKIPPNEWPIFQHHVVGYSRANDEE